MSTALSIAFAPCFPQKATLQLHQRVIIHMQQFADGRMVRTVSGRRQFNTRDGFYEVSFEDQMRASEKELDVEAQYAPLPDEEVEVEPRGCCGSWGRCPAASRRLLNEFTRTGAYRRTGHARTGS